jgi:hypothetical protein
MLKFSVQIFYQPLFSHSFPFSNSFPFQSFPHQKAQNKRTKPKPQKPTKAKKPKAKSPSSSFRDLLLTVANRVEQRLSGRGVTL